MTLLSGDDRHATARHRASGRVGGLIRLLRPRQWSKNVLLLAAPAAAGVLHRPQAFAEVLVGVLCFCMVASGTYCINDVLDADADRTHPVKRHRPIASGSVRSAEGVGLGVVMMVGGIAVSNVALPSPFSWTLATYGLLTLSYSRWLKHVAIVDILVVAAGFVLRAMAGGFAVGVELSEWFLIVATFGALFIVVSKRHAEVQALGDARAAHRAVLADYDGALTRHLMTTASAVTLVSYGLWTFSVQEVGGMSEPWPALSLLPCVYVLARYAMLVFAGHGGEPEELALRDRGLQIAGAVWAALIVMGVYT